MFDLKIDNFNSKMAIFIPTIAFFDQKMNNSDLDVFSIKNSFSITPPISVGSK